MVPNPARATDLWRPSAARRAAIAEQAERLASFRHLRLRLRLASIDVVG
jgi:hypothetical protein